MKKIINAKRSQVINYLYNPYRFYYNTLPNGQKKLYDTMAAGLLQNKATIEIPRESSDVIFDVFNKLKMDNPLIFNADKVTVESRLFSQSQIVIPEYKYSAEDAIVITDSLIQKTREIVSRFRGLSPIQIEQSIHDYLCSTIVYNMKADMANEAIGPVLHNSGVCDGIAKAAKLLFDMSEIQSFVVHGTAASSNASIFQDHSWNIVSINGTFYHLDITYDLTIKMYGVLRYDYYNLSDEEIKRDHIISVRNIVHCPLSNNYYKTHNQYFRREKDLQEYLNYALQQNSKDIVFQISDQSALWKNSIYIKQLIEESVKNIKLHGKKYTIYYNDWQSVFHIHEQR